MIQRIRIALVGPITLLVGMVPLAVGIPSALAATLNVCAHCQYKTIQSAVNHAGEGDIIRVAAGTYHGPIIVNTSVKLIGAGSATTVITGGDKGPVVRIGVDLSGPTVSIAGVTVTGGRNTSYPDSVEPSGGGVRVEVGATVTVAKSLISGNSVRSLGSQPCGSHMCSNSVGGGISTSGDMTLNNTTVSNNAALNRGASADSNSASGGGIDAGGSLVINNSAISANKVVISSASKQQSDLLVLGGGLAVSGSVTVKGSRIDGNSVTTTAYTGIAGAGAGGIEQRSGSLLLVGSEVSHNRARSTVTSTQTSAAANTDAAAMEVNGSVTVKRTKFIDNSLISRSPAALANGGTTAFGAAIFNFSQTPATMTDIVVSGNTAVATTTSGTANASLGALFNGGMPLTLSGSTVAGNSAKATSASGPATVQGAGVANGSSLTLVRSSVHANRAKATSSSATATVQGPGILNGGTMKLQSTMVTRNTGTAAGSTGTAQGGGIWNGNQGNGPPKLTLVGSAVTHNILTASNTKISVQGGGVFTTAHVILMKSIIAHNVPDQCFGC